MKNLFLILLLSSCSTSNINKTIDLIQNQTIEKKNIKPTNKEMKLGLKEALSVGFSRAVDKLNKKDGFLKNPLIKIPVPKDIKKVSLKLESLGFKDIESKVEELINRSAEQASGEAKDIFITAIKELTVKDALKILMGNNNEATLYLKKKTTNQLINKFKPIINNSLNKQGALDYYTKITQTYNRIPFINDVETNPTKYVTDKALKGIFYSIEEQEKLIRENPIKRSTQLLQKVFNYIDLNKK